METNKSEINEPKKSKSEPKIVEPRRSKSESVVPKLRSARKLKDYAISENLDVPDEIIKKLSESRGDECIDESEIDIAIRDLTSITYPTTIKTLEATQELKPDRFLVSLVILGGLVLFLAIFSNAKAMTATTQSDAWHSLVNVCLGVLGALVYVFFNLIGVMKAQAFEPSAKFENSVRIVLGGILGWLLFYTFRAKITDREKYLFALLPFLAGFSTRLVFGILNQAIRAIEITLGMEGTSSKILRRPKGDKTLQTHR